MTSTDNDPLPTSSLQDLYGKDGTAASERVQYIRRQFTDTFKHEPEVLFRAPGRVNLIGEHVDHQGYGVLPMALSQDTIIAIRRTEQDASIRVANTDQAGYPEASYSTDPSQEVDRSGKQWAGYFLCGYKGVYDRLEEKGAARPPPTGLQVLVDGCVPPSAGLSSSSAFVVASAGAVQASHACSFTKAELAEVACVCERYIGTAGGGMDQAISCLAAKGVAKRVNFNPVRTEDVQLPEDMSFVIANSLTRSAKAETAHERYNLRVVECRAAAVLLAVALGRPPAAAVAEVRALRAVEALCGGTRQAALAAARAHLHAHLYTREELEAALQCSLPSVFEGNVNALAAIDYNTRGYNLLGRAVHVFSEAARVDDFYGVCAALQGPAAAPSPAREQQVAQLGSLMDASHASCRDDYQCSCPELDHLVQVCKEQGALGARLTGAGWGGCVVAMVPDAAAAAFIAALKTHYFADHMREGSVTEATIDQVVFASKPGAGAAILKD